MTASGPTVTLRPLEPADWPAVRRIYEEGIATGDATFETAAPSWEAWDAGHLPTCRLVAVEGDRLLGWTALSPTSRRSVYAGVAEEAIYVAADGRGRGVGRALLEALIAESERHGTLDAPRRHLPRKHRQPRPPRALRLPPRRPPGAHRPDARRPLA